MGIIQMNKISQKTISQKRGRATEHVHFERAGNYYIASWNSRGELSVFNADASGNITDWGEVLDYWANHCKHLFN